MACATTAAKMIGMDSVAGTPVTSRTTIAIMKGAGKAAAVKAAIIQPTVRASGMLGKIQVDGRSGRATHKEQGEDRPADKASGYGSGRGQDLGENQYHNQSYAHGGAVLCHEFQSSRTQKHGQGQGHAQQSQKKAGCGATQDGLVFQGRNQPF